ISHPIRMPIAPAPNEPNGALGGLRRGGGHRQPPGPSPRTNPIPDPSTSVRDGAAAGPGRSSPNEPSTGAESPHAPRPIAVPERTQRRARPSPLPTPHSPLGTPRAPRPAPPAPFGWSATALCALALVLGATPTVLGGEGAGGAAPEGAGMVLWYRR